MPELPAATPRAEVARDEPRAPLLVITLALLLLAAAAYLAIRQIGMQLEAPGAGQAAGKAVPAANALPSVLLALVVIIATARLMGALFKRVRQPPVVGEVLAGILLGPSLLGQVAPDALSALFPPAVVTPLSTIAHVGVVLFMFIVGLELDTGVVRQRMRATVLVSVASIVAPFVLGSALALVLYPRLSSPDVPFTAFSLFLGVSMSVTAFPVLARILTDRGYHRSGLGIIALTCAAMNDVAAWCMLAFVVGVVHAKLGGAALTIVLTAVYVCAMIWVARPLAERLLARYESGAASGQSLMAAAAVGLLLSCLATESIGIHALFGAFMLGAVMPHNSRAAHALFEKINDFVVVMLLPAFFALTGLRTQIGLVGGAYWLTTVLIIAVAFVGKFGGAAAAARFTGLSWRDASSLGILMNTRGLMELIVLNVGLDLGVISPRLFAMLVIMAVVATLMTGPILDRLVHPGWRGEGEQAGPAGPNL
jgi:Kef-type K+ transport system membrane component KefB